ncbi:TyrS-associated PheT N-terminal domain-related protein TapR [Mycoplasma aquilae ATCC BAA-1896]|uniref:TyrS-associated PheT N-terminal domain-related protein TapR n=1 Tax=Mycoplasma aquilae TaxID=1312741 RepID=UPI003A86FA25
MILFNNLDKVFKNTSVLFVDSRIQKVHQIKHEDLVFFVDQDNKVASINVLNNAKYYIPEDVKFGYLPQAGEDLILAMAKELNLELVHDQKFIYGLIQERKAHPKSERLFVLKVQISPDSSIQLVTNTLDSQEGKVVVLALPGSTTLAGTDVLSGEMLNVASQGMLTGYKTLGLEGEGLIFGQVSQIGKDFKLS